MLQAYDLRLWCGGADSAAVRTVTKQARPCPLATNSFCPECWLGGPVARAVQASRPPLVVSQTPNDLGQGGPLWCTYAEVWASPFGYTPGPPCP